MAAGLTARRGRPPVPQWTSRLHAGGPLRPAGPLRITGPLSVPDQGMNDTPSSEVKHWALEKPPSDWTVTTPLCWMNRRPLVALHKSTGTKTFVPGRKFAGSVNGTVLVPEVAMAPLKWTTPLMLRTAALDVAKGALVQTFLRVSWVSALTCFACAAPAPRRGRMTAVTHKAPVAISRSRFTDPHFP